MNCIILEDEAMALSVLEDYVNKVPFLELSGSFRSPLQAIDFVSKEKPELLFLDINMPDLSGLDFLDTLNYQPYVIFTTAYSEYTLKSFEYNTLDYLLKPIRFSRFLKAVTKVKMFLEDRRPELAPNQLATTEQSITLKNTNGTHRVFLNSIVYVESFKNYVTYHTEQEKIEIKQSLSEVEKILPQEQFMRVHRSFVVNTSFIKSLKYDGIQLRNDIKLPVGRSYRESINTFFST
ncbi:LytR/AlgR family response regulator transcription factor [Aquimarina brevivitae]|uniref:LytTR family two component transcriptional regulator n=1 Tax=Aquimarina brevivitae TaxID=323412 RepID=A0A4Q7P343_9FLAO|nr:LytTR family DNA-binding domain-containing protein [Aquimarina brevivitae]RZS93810.1 LytTR family two component transcriptional regulator [Aquimarina brevivitae]